MTAELSAIRCTPVGQAILRLLRQAWVDLLRTEQLVATSATIPNDALRKEAAEMLLAARQLVAGVGELLRREVR